MTKTKNSTSSVSPWETIFETEFGNFDFLVRYKNGTKLYFITSARKRKIIGTFDSDYNEIQYKIKGADKHRSGYDKEMSRDEVLANRMDFIPFHSLNKTVRKELYEAIDSKADFSYWNKYETTDNSFNRLSQFLSMTQDNMCAYDTYDKWKTASEGMRNMHNEDSDDDCGKDEQELPSLYREIGEYDNHEITSDMNDGLTAGETSCITADSGVVSSITGLYNSDTDVFVSSNPCGEILVCDGNSGVGTWEDGGGDVAMYNPYSFKPIGAVPAPMEEKNDVKLLRKKRNKRKTVRFSEQKPVVLKS